MADVCSPTFCTSFILILWHLSFQYLSRGVLVFALEVCTAWMWSQRSVHLWAVLTKVQVILLTLGFSAEDYSPTLGSITINRLVLFPACLGVFKCDFVCNKYSLALLCTTIYCYFGARANTLLLPLDSAYTCTDPYCQVLVLQCCCWFQTDFFFFGQIHSSWSQLSWQKEQAKIWKARSSQWFWMAWVHQWSTLHLEEKYVHLWDFFFSGMLVGWGFFPLR